MSTGNCPHLLRNKGAEEEIDLEVGYPERPQALSASVFLVLTFDDQALKEENGILAK